MFSQIEFSINFSVLAPALLAGVLIILTHTPLGVAVFKKGIIFIDIAIAQAAALGTIIAHQIFPHYVEQNHFISQICAFVAAILAATILTFTDKKLPKFQEAIIGSFFVFSAGLAMILLSTDPHGAEDFQNILAGQILWTSFRDVLWLAIFYLPILIIWFKFKDKIGNTGFYLLFALTITASVQIVGVYLVFSFLIFPAFIAANFSNYKKQIGFSYLVAVLGLILGVLISAKFDYPTGPAISICLAVVVILGCLVIRIWRVINQP
jgi:zinc/manganese transport system permease protein